MDIIEMARELGKALQQDERYQKLDTARKNNDADVVLQNMIEDFNVKRVALGAAMNETPKDDKKVANLNHELQQLYGEIMANEHMLAFNEAKQEVDKVLNFITQILSGSVNGQDPDEIEEYAGCSGSCESCGGCH